MHNLIVAGCFLLLVLVPCIVAVFSSSKEGPSGNSGEHEAAQPVTAARGHSPSRIRSAAEAMAARKEARRIAEEATTMGQRPSRIRMAAAAAFSKASDDQPASQRPSRLHRVASALIHKEVKKQVPVVVRDPGSPQHSIRDLRAKHAAAAKPKRV